MSASATLSEPLLELADGAERTGPSNRLDSPYAGGDSGLAGEAERPDLAGAAHVGPTAQLDRRAHLDDADAIAVLLGEERHGAEGERIGIGHLASGDDRVAENGIVHLVLDPMKRVRVDGPVMGEVEAQSLRLHQTALLPDMGPEMLAERVVHEMRGAVVALDIVPPRRIDRRVRRIGIEGLLETCPRRRCPWDPFARNPPAASNRHR